MSRGDVVILRHRLAPFLLLALCGISWLDAPEWVAETHDSARLIGLNIPWRHGLFFIFPSRPNSYASWDIVQEDNECVLRATCGALSHVRSTRFPRWLLITNTGMPEKNLVYHVSWCTKIVDNH